jgi:hypothetical protein
MSMGATGKAPTGPTTPAYEPKASATDLAQFQRRFHAVHTMPNYVGGHPEGELGATGNPQNKVILKKPLALDTTPSLYAMPDRHKKNESVEMQHEADDLEEMMRLAGMGEALKGGQKKLDKNKNGKLDATDFAMLRGEMEEGNEFTGALDAARDAGKKEFEVDGQTYPVKEEMDEGSEMCEGCGYTMTECGCDSSMPDQEQEGRMNVSMNVSSDGSQNLSVNAEGDQAVKLAQLLKLAGLSSGPEQVYSPVQVSMHGEHDHEHGHEEMEEAKDERYHASTTPDEQVYDLAVQLKGGNGDVAGQEKPMHKHGYKFSDNPLAMNESIAKDYASIKVAKK